MFQDSGPPVIVIPEPGMLSDLISEKLHALADDYSEEPSLDQCAKFFQEYRQGIIANERLLSESSDSMDTDEEEYIQRRKLKKRVRWKSNISGKSQIHITQRECIEWCQDHSDCSQPATHLISDKICHNSQKLVIQATAPLTKQVVEICGRIFASLDVFCLFVLNN